MKLKSHNGHECIKAGNILRKVTEAKNNSSQPKGTLVEIVDVSIDYSIECEFLTLKAANVYVTISYIKNECHKLSLRDFIKLFGNDYEFVMNIHDLKSFNPKLEELC